MNKDELMFVRQHMAHMKMPPEDPINSTLEIDPVSIVESYVLDMMDDLPCPPNVRQAVSREMIATVIDDPATYGLSLRELHVFIIAQVDVMITKLEE